MNQPPRCGERGQRGGGERVAPFPEYRWIDVAVGGAERRNHLVDAFRWRPPQGASDCYRTVYRYPDAMQAHFRDRRSVSGYAGPLYADWLPIDFDAEGDLDRALASARVAVQQLQVRFDLRAEELRLYFSGSKGFHLLVPAAMFSPEPSPTLNATFAAMAGRMFDGVEYDAGIYDNVRLFRVSNTRHGKTGLYKVPLTPAELLSLDSASILELAKQPRSVAAWDPSENEALRELYLECRCADHRSRSTAAGESKPVDLSPDARPCIAAMLAGVSERRHDTSLRIACHFARQGVPEDGILALLHAWNRRNGPPIDQRRADQEFPKTAAAAMTYDFGCNDPLRQKFCAGRCPFRNRQPQGEPPEPEVSIVNQVDAYGIYMDYVRDLGRRKISLGFPLLDKHTRGLAPGEVMEIIARAGVGKTALLLNILRSVSRCQQVPILFFSLEMPLAQVFERTVQIAADLRGDDVEEIAPSSQADDHAFEPFSLAMDDFRWVWYVDRDFLRFEDLERTVAEAPRRIGEPVRLVCIDYLGRMRGAHGRSAYEVTSELAQQLKHLAKSQDVAVIYLHQTSRAGTDGSTPVTLDMSRDSGVTEEAADFVLGMWRPEMAESYGSETEVVQVAILKARRGSQGHVRLIFKKPTLRMAEAGVAPVPAQKRGRHGKVAAS